VQKYLHWIKQAVTATCPGCGQTEETVLHYLIHCQKYTNQCNALRQELGRKASKPSYLLSNPAALPALFRYIAATKRFTKIYSNSPELAEGWQNPHEGTRNSTQCDQQQGTEENRVSGPDGGPAAWE
jgi:hypothetical protein